MAPPPDEPLPEAGPVPMLAMFSTIAQEAPAVIRAISLAARDMKNRTAVNNFVKILLQQQQVAVLLASIGAKDPEELRLMVERSRALEGMNEHDVFDRFMDFAVTYLHTYPARRADLMLRLHPEESPHPGERNSRAVSQP